jgi:hypothetical protein
MKLDEYLAEQRAALNAFEKYWLAENSHDPESYPLEMGAGDWNEQVGFFLAEY